MAKYYLIGANKKEQRAEVLTVDQKKEFADIADVDLATTILPKETFREEIDKTNENFILARDSIFVAQYPFKKVESKLYYNLKDGSSKRSKELILGLRDFAKERSELVSLKEKLILEKNSDFHIFVSELIDDILRDLYQGGGQILNQDSLVISYIKDKVNLISNTYGYNDRMFYIGKLEEKLRDYKALRNLILEYIAFLDKENTALRPNLLRFSKTVTNGHFTAEDFVTEAIENKDGCFQYTLNLK